MIQQSHPGYISGKDEICNLERYMHYVHNIIVHNSQDQEEPKCPSTEEWIKKMWYTYIVEYYAAINEWNNAICSHMDGPRDRYTDWSKSGRERQPLYHHIYVESKKKKKLQINLFKKQKLTDIETNLWLKKGKEVGEE